MATLEQLVREAYQLYCKTSILFPYQPNLNWKAYQRFKRRFQKSQPADGITNQCTRIASPASDQPVGASKESGNQGQ